MWSLALQSHDAPHHRSLSRIQLHCASTHSLQAKFDKQETPTMTTEWLSSFKASDACRQWRMKWYRKHYDTFMSQADPAGRTAQLAINTANALWDNMPDEDRRTIQQTETH
jgi:hypothetical protein